MAYQKYTGLANSDEVMKKISDYAVAQGWIILDNNVPDLAIDGSGVYDGVKLGIKSPDGRVFASLRSANGKNIFGTQKNLNNAYGIGLTCSTSYTSNPASGLWYDQTDAPVEYHTQKVIGVGIPINPNGGNTLYVNSILDPAPLFVISVEMEGVFQHLAFGYLQKVGDWDGGVIFSGSRNSYEMFTAGFSSNLLESGTSPLFAMTTEANTFLRIDMDAAPLRQPSVLWASAGSNAAAFANHYTGLQMALPIRTSEVGNSGWNVHIPNYRKLQSQSTLDTGRNVNTLNCITVNLNLTAYVIRDPQGLRNFSPVGYVPGVYAISMRNVAPAQCYEISYPQSGYLHQVFPHTRRRGVYGFDGFSVQQS